MLKFLNYLFDLVITFLYIKWAIYFGTSLSGLPLIFMTVIWYSVIGENYFNKSKIYVLKRYRRFISKKIQKKSNNENI